MSLKQKFSSSKIPFALIGMCITAIAGFSTLRADVTHNKESITKLENAPVKIAETTQKVENLDKNMGEFKAEQRLRFQKVDEKLDKVLDALIGGR